MPKCWRCKQLSPWTSMISRNGKYYDPDCWVESVKELKKKRKVKK